MSQQFNRIETIGNYPALLAQPLAPFNRSTVQSRTTAGRVRWPNMAQISRVSTLVAMRNSPVNRLNLVRRPHVIRRWLPMPNPTNHPAESKLILLGIEVAVA
jgi:hypothetical protein